jgi:trans-aconitate 2-methyltransferase
MSAQGDTWKPQQYERFRQERRQPFVDLLHMVERRPTMHIVDLGCGTGELTRELHETLEAATTLGIDNSAKMLAASRAHKTDRLRFAQDDIAGFTPGRTFGLVFSNAALHWLPDHETLFRRLRTLVAPGGQIAIQMPLNHEHTSHITAANVAAEQGIEPVHYGVLPPERYAELLYELGFKRPRVHVEIYGHELESVRAVVEWVRGSLLTDYQRRMTAEEFATFIERYTQRLIAILGDRTPYFYTYKRVLMQGRLDD